MGSHRRGAAGRRTGEGRGPRIGRGRGRAELAAAEAAEVIVVDAPALEDYTADGYVAALAALIGQEQPSHVFLPHTYQTRDFAPALAARLHAR